MVRRVRRDVRRDDILGDIAVRGREVPPVFRHDALDGSGLTHLLDLSAAHPCPPEASGGVHEGDLHDAIGAHVGEGIDQDAVDDAEDRARGAYPKGQREDRGEGEPRAAAQFARGIAKIGEE